MLKETKVDYNGVSIILPAFNEEANIFLVVTDIIRYLDCQGMQGEIIVVNDGSSDSTAEIVNRVAEENKRVSLIDHDKNRGYGVSIRDGINKAKYDLVFFTDADRQFDIKGLDIMLPLMYTGVMDIIVGYRLYRKDPFLRKFLSWGFNTIVGFLFDLQVKDVDCAFKLFRRDIFSKIEIESEKFFINTEILSKSRRLGLNILEVGVRHFPRTAGKSTVSLKYIFITIRELFRIWRELRYINQK